MVVADAMSKIWAKILQNEPNIELTKSHQETILRDSTFMKYYEVEFIEIDLDVCGRYFHVTATHVLVKQPYSAKPKHLMD